MGLFDRSSSVVVKEKTENVDELLERITKETDELIKSFSGGEKDKAEELIEKENFSFLEKLKQSKDKLDEGFIFVPSGRGIISAKTQKEGYEPAEIQKVVATGVLRSGYAIADFLAGVVDLSGHTKLSEKLDQIYSQADTEKLEPETVIGQMGSLLIEYGFPGSIGVKVAQRLRLLPKFYRKLNKIPDRKSVV